MSDPEIARFACSFEGVQPFVDLEVHGKAERQGHMASWKSQQTINDVTKIREATPGSLLVVRINPLHANTRKEVDEVIARGADSVMLPMFHDRTSLAQFLDILNDRAEAFPLFETAASVASIPNIVPALGIKRLHIGLNDLHLDLGQDFLFQPLAEGYLEEPTQSLRSLGIEFGIGGIARTQEGIIGPDFLLGEHVRLGSSAAILSQTFHRNARTLDELNEQIDFEKELTQLRAIHADFVAMEPAELEVNRVKTTDRINDVVHLIRQKGQA